MSIQSKKPMRWWKQSFKEINVVVRFLILSDIVFQGAAGLFGPLFALYIGAFILDGDPIVITGVASAIFLITKSISQIPAAWIIDKIKGERDDFNIMFWGSVIAALMPISYIYINSAWQIYLIQFFYGLVTAATFPSYMAIFTRHIDHAKEGTEWGVYYTLVDIATAVTAAIGGTMASMYGFPMVIVVSSVLTTVGALLLWPLRPYMHKT